MAHQVFIFLSLFLAYELSQAKLDVLTDVSPVTAKPGDTIHLKCILNLGREPLDMKEYMIQWFTRGTQIAEFDNKITIDKPGVTLSEEALKKGDATLTITSAKEDDSGNYRCYVSYKSDVRMKQIVLKVEDPNKPKKEEEEPLLMSDVLLSRKMDKVIEWFGKFDAKMEELLGETKKCAPQTKPARAH